MAIENSEIFDTLLDLKNLPTNYAINRFEINHNHKSLLIKEGRTKNHKNLIQAIVSIVFTVIFAFFTFMSLAVNAKMFVTVILATLTLISIGYSINQIIRGYFSSRLIVLDSSKLIVKKLGREKCFLKSDVRSVYVRDLIINSERRIEIRLGKRTYNSRHEDYTLITLDLPNSSWFSVKKNLSNFEKTKKEAFQICKIISDYWHIPFRV